MRFLSASSALCLYLLVAPVAGVAFDWFSSPNPSHDNLNPSNDKLLKMNESQQAAVLTRATRGGCMAKDPYYMGTEWRAPNEGVAFWSINCANSGASFMIAVAPDSTGTTRVFSCNLERGHPWTCFEKLKDAK